MQLAETGKIRIFKQSPGSFVHPFKVRSLEQTATILTIERHLGRSNIVFVCTCRGIKARMSIGTYGTQTVNGNIRGSRRFSLSVMNITSNGVSLSKCATIRGSMYTGIGASGTHHLHFTPQQGRECFHQTLLHTCTVGLNLPAMISCAVVGQIDKISLHVSFYSWIWLQRYKKRGKSSKLFQLFYRITLSLQEFSPQITQFYKVQN